MSRGRFQNVGGQFKGMSLGVGRPKQDSSAIPPSNKMPPSIELVGSGPIEVGKLVRLSLGTWRRAASVSGSLVRLPNTVLIASVTELQTYQLVEADAGALLQLVASASNPHGTVEARSVPFGPVLSASNGQAQFVLPGPDYLQNADINAEIDWISGTGTLYGALLNGSTQVGARQAFTAADEGQTRTFVPNATGSAWTIRIYNAPTDGTQIWSSANFTVIGATPAVTINTPSSPQPADTPIAVSGTYAGSLAGQGVRLQWRSADGSTAVGSPVMASSAVNGNWSGTISTPVAGGTYRLRATHVAGGVNADSGTVDVDETSGPLGQFVFEGTGV